MVTIGNAGVRRRLVVGLLSAGMVAGAVVGPGAGPASAEISAVSGSAFGYSANVGLFGGPASRQGAGQVVCPPAPDPQPQGCLSESAAAASASPAVTLPPEGSSDLVTADDADGAKAQFGPAVIFGGIWPENGASAPPSGPLTVGTVGTPSGGSVTSSAEVRLLDTPRVVPCASGVSGPCTAPGGFGPGPLVGERAESTCTADASGVSGSSTFTNGILELKYDKNSQLPVVTEAIPVNPPPNYTRSGTIDHVGDRFTIVLNQQIVGPDSITVNAAHMYLLGDNARGDLVVGSSTCSLSSTVPNASPVAGDDTYGISEDESLTLSAPGLLANDADPDGEMLRAGFIPPVAGPGPGFTFPSDPPHGSVAVDPDGSFVYTPDANFVGTDVFDYQAYDARGAADSATVTVAVAPVADAPVAGDDFEQSVENVPLAVAAPGVLGNDTDADGDSLTAGAASDPPHGSVALNTDGSYTYTPDANFNGTDTFSYTATDSTGRSDTALVSIVINFDEASILKDIDPGKSGSEPSGFVHFGDSVYFFTATFSDPSRTGLWKTDGSKPGTTLVKPLRGSGSITVMGGSMFFQADGGTGDFELWKSDGTAAGTVLVKDIHPGESGSDIRNVKLVADTLYFQANDGSSGAELWKSDGTEAGTVLVKDINPGAASSNANGMQAAGSTVYFQATTSTTGTELWKTDGTEAGTALVKDINAGTATSNPTLLQAIGTTVYFQASNGTGAGSNGIELWRSDGTGAGTVLVKDISPGTASSRPNFLKAIGSTLWFSANDGLDGAELWKSDGTEEGTVEVRNLNPGFNGSSPNQFTVLGDAVLFSASGGTGSELWKTDGTEAGTVQVKEIYPGTNGSSPSGFALFGDDLYFSANDGVHGAELWKTDGTTEGTLMAEDLFPGASDKWSSPGQLTPALGTMFFSALGKGVGREPWRLTPPRELSVAGVSVSEGDSGTRNAVFTVTLLVPKTSTVTVDYSTADGTAVAGSDYTAKSGTLTFTPGITTLSVKVPVTGDTADEVDESFTLVLATASGAAIVYGNAVGTIVDDDPKAAGRYIAIGDASVYEGDSGVRTATFTVSLSKAASSTVSVNYTAVDATATSPGDYVASAGKLTFAAGITTMTVKVTVNPDNAIEGDEAFAVNLSTVTGPAVILDGSGVGTILDDDVS
ncbi:MAG TPA: ELWxxDGT repeat protein [Acidimicrobiales bacterium]|nr:ELWxxDGT repeat protein [Acidimicrobiales bacterium]